MQLLQQPKVIEMLQDDEATKHMGSESLSEECPKLDSGVRFSVESVQQQVLMQRMSMRL